MSVRSIEPTADHVWLEGGFETGKVYQLTYLARIRAAAQTLVRDRYLSRKTRAHSHGRRGFADVAASRRSKPRRQRRTGTLRLVRRAATTRSGIAARMIDRRYRATARTRYGVTRLLS